MKINFDDRHVRWATLALVVIICSIIVFFIMFRFDDFQNVLGAIVSILTPFIYGLVMAYLLCPVYNVTVRGMYRLMTGTGRKIPKALTISKAIGTVAALITLFVVVSGVLWMIIPGLVDSIVNIIDILPDSMARLTDWLNARLQNYPELDAMLSGLIDDFTANAVSFVTDTMVPEYTAIATTVSEGLLGIFNALVNAFAAIIICVYFLNSKEVFAAQSKKAIIAVCSERVAKEILDGAVFTNRTFGKFINGKLIDSLVVGVICFICMTIFGWEYSLLISCIIGITNIIPFFGPFIGAIPSALLLLMVDPSHCFYFVIFILILQQIDGNILEPKILGDSTGLSSFWVLFAVLVGGGLFGWVGMIIGIPIFAVIYMYVSRIVNGKLSKRGFSTDLSDYKVDQYRVRKKKRVKKVVVKRDGRGKDNDDRTEDAVGGGSDKEDRK